MRNNLYIFDLDHTLVKFDKNEMCIDVIDDNFGTIFKVKYSDYLEGKYYGYRFFFEEFFSSKKFLETAIPIKPTIRIMNEVVGMGCDVRILTARTHFDCRQTLKQSFDSLNIPNVPIHCCGFELSGNSCKSSIPNKKIEGFKKIINEQHTEVVIYEDDIDNMKAIASISSQFPHVENWDFRLVELSPDRTTITKVPLV